MQVLAPKVAASEKLGATVKASPLRSLVLFSSTATLLGPPGQANYAAANAALDAWGSDLQASGLSNLTNLCFHCSYNLVRGQQARLPIKAGVAVMSVRWGAWATGMAASEATLRRFQRMGMGALQAVEGLRVLSLVMQSMHSARAPAEVPLLPISVASMIVLYAVNVIVSIFNLSLRGLKSVILSTLSPCRIKGCECCICRLWPTTSSGSGCSGPASWSPSSLRSLSPRQPRLSRKPRRLSVPEVSSQAPAPAERPHWRRCQELCSECWVLW